MILQVNDINFENMSNDDAVRVLREAVQKPGFVTFSSLTYDICFVLFLFSCNKIVFRRVAPRQMVAAVMAKCIYVIVIYYSVGVENNFLLKE